MNNKRLLALFGLKGKPFFSNIPVQALGPAPGIDTFLFQIENLVMDGGFALMGGEPGLGKSNNLEYLVHNLEQLENVVVGVMERPQSSLAGFTVRWEICLVSTSRPPTDTVGLKLAGSVGGSISNPLCSGRYS